MELQLNSVGEGIFGLDHEGLVIFSNPVVSQVLGWTSEELLRKKMHSLIHQAHSDGSVYEETACPVYQTFHLGVANTISGEIFWKKNGESFPEEYTSTPILEDHHPVGVMVVFRDISDRLRSESQLLKAVQARDEVLGIASHELKTPMKSLRLQV